MDGSIEQSIFVVSITDAEFLAGFHRLVGYLEREHTTESRSKHIATKQDAIRCWVGTIA